MIINFLQYQLTLAALWLHRDIDARSWWFAARTRPVVVCGRKGGFVVDSSFDMTPAQRQRISAIQFILGMLLVAGAVAWLETILGAKFTLQGGYEPLVKALALLVGGLVLAMDASLAAANRWLRYGAEVQNADRA